MRVGRAVSWAASVQPRGGEICMLNLCYQRCCMVWRLLAERARAAQGSTVYLQLASHSSRANARCGLLAGCVRVLACLFEFICVAGMRCVSEYQGCACCAMCLREVCCTARCGCRETRGSPVSLRRADRQASLCSIASTRGPLAGSLRGMLAPTSSELASVGTNDIYLRSAHACD